MASSIDPAFEVWLAALPDLGYDRMWITHNIEALRERYLRGEMMPPCPQPSGPRDRYEEL